MSESNQKSSGLNGCLPIIGAVIILAILTSGFRAMFGNTWVMRDTKIRDARVQQIEQHQRDLVESTRAEMPTWTNFSTNVEKEDADASRHHDYNRQPLPSAKELCDYFSNMVVDWDRKTPQQRHQDAIDQEWAEYQAGKAADEAQKDTYRQTLWDLTHEDKAKDNAQKEVDKFLQGKP
jgi:hypothetical protein